MNARVLLTETDSPNRAKIEAALERFDRENSTSGPKVRLNPETYSKLAAMLRKIDPMFQERWHQSLLRDYPWLDRVLPK